MALTQETKIDRVEILEDGQVQVREANVISDNGVEVARNFNRYVLDPATDSVDDVNAKIAGKAGVDVSSIVNAIWTPTLVAERQTAVEQANALRAQATPEA